MGIKIKERIYTHIERPQDQNISLLLGNVGVWQKLSFLAQISADINFSLSNTLFMEEPNIFTLTDGSFWQEQGFGVGDNFTVQWTVLNIPSGISSVYVVTGTVVSINGSQMISSNGTLGGGAQVSNIYPVQLADDKIHSVFIATDKIPDELFFQPGHLRNSDSDSLNLRSFIDGTDTFFRARDVSLMSLGQTIPIEAQGLQSGMSIESCDLTYLGVSSGGSPPYTYTTYTYRIDMVFMISSFFEDINTFSANESPPQTLDKECLTDNFIIKAYPTFNNPNISISNDLKLTKQLGVTGWFDENYNGGVDDFTIKSIEYKNSNGTIISQLDYKNTTSCKVIIDGIANISGQTKCTYGFQWVPTIEADYKELETPFHENTKINTGGGYLSDVFNVSNIIDGSYRQGFSNDGASMDTQNIRFQQTGPQEITFECDFTPNPAFTAFMEKRDLDDRNYIIWVNVGDQNLLTNKSNRVCKRVDFNQMDTFIEPLGEYEGMQIGFLTHPQDLSDSPSICGNDIRIEDDISARIEFLVNTNVSVDIPVITGIEYGILIERSSDGFQYFLDKYPIDLTQYPDVSQYNFEASRGFKYGLLPPNNSKNVISAKYYPSIDSGSSKGVLGFYGFKVRWEDWISRFNVPFQVNNNFYDNTLKNNGLSNDWYAYLLNSGWRMYFYVFTNAELDSNPVRYENKKELLFKDYNDNDNITTTVTYKRESDQSIISGGTDAESGLPLGVILSNEPVRVEIEYNRLTGTWANLNSVYFTTTIEVREGAGQSEFRQLSNIWLPEPDNPLEPLNGDSLLNVVLVSPTVIKTSCLINPNKLLNATAYKITGRSGCRDAFEIGGQQQSSVVEFDGFIYGTSRLGGDNGLGYIWKMNLSDPTYTSKVIYNFEHSNRVGLLYAEGKLFGCTDEGGDNNLGYFYSIAINDNTFTKLISLSTTTGYRFSQIATSPNFNTISNPLYYSNGFIYGSPRLGRNNNFGGVFKYEISTNSITLIGPSFLSDNSGWNNFIDTGSGVFEYTLGVLSEIVGTTLNPLTVDLNPDSSEVEAPLVYFQNKVIYGFRDVPDVSYIYAYDPISTIKTLIISGGSLTQIRNIFTYNNMLYVMDSSKVFIFDSTFSLVNTVNMPVSGGSSMGVGCVVGNYFYFRRVIVSSSPITSLLWRMDLTSNMFSKIIQTYVP